MRDLKVLQVDQLFQINSHPTTIPECVVFFFFLSPRLFCKKRIPKRRRGRALTAGRDNPPKIEEDSARDGQEVVEEEEENSQQVRSGCVDV